MLVAVLVRTRAGAADIQLPSGLCVPVASPNHHGTHLTKTCKLRAGLPHRVTTLLSKTYRTQVLASESAAGVVHAVAMHSTEAVDGDLAEQDSTDSVAAGLCGGPIDRR